MFSSSWLSSQWHLVQYDGISNQRLGFNVFLVWLGFNRAIHLSRNCIQHTHLYKSFKEDLMLLRLKQQSQVICQSNPLAFQEFNHLRLLPNQFHQQEWYWLLIFLNSSNFIQLSPNEFDEDYQSSRQVLVIYNTLARSIMAKEYQWKDHHF